MFKLENAQYRYDPYPLSLLQPALDEGFYDDLCATYPSRDVFEYMPHLGNKYSLRRSHKAYHEFIAATPPWKKFYGEIMKPEFIEQTLAACKAHNLDLDLRRYKVVSGKKGKRTSVLNRVRRIKELNARFEFSMMGSAGGNIRPHTDSSNKLITFVLTIVRPGEWDTAWGGGTDVVWPIDRTRSFNRANRMMGFDEVETLFTYAFNPNQCLLFVKTDTSWHAVAPMQGPSAEITRKTITINIEQLLN